MSEPNRPIGGVGDSERESKRLRTRQSTLRRRGGTAHDSSSSSLPINRIQPQSPPLIVDDESTSAIDSNNASNIRFWNDFASVNAATNADTSRQFTLATQPQTESTQSSSPLPSSDTAGTGLTSSTPENTTNLAQFFNDSLSNINTPTEPQDISSPHWDLLNIFKWKPSIMGRSTPSTLKTLKPTQTSTRLKSGNSLANINQSSTSHLEGLRRLAASSSSSSFFFSEQTGGGQSQPIDRELLCPICMEIFKEPFISCCGHSFCFACISMHLEQKNECPTCRVLLHKDNIFPNFALSKLLEKSRVTSNGGSSNVQFNWLTGSKSVPKELEMLAAMISQTSKSESLEKHESYLLVQHFLAKTHAIKQKELSRLQAELALLNSDIGIVEQKLGDLSSLHFVDTSMVEDQFLPLNNGDGVANVPDIPLDLPIEVSSSRKRTYAEFSSPMESQSEFSSIAKRKHIQRISEHFDDLKNVYFESRITESHDNFQCKTSTEEEIDKFSSTVSKIARKSRFKTLHTLDYHDSFYNNTSSIVSSIEFDKDDQHFATAGVARKIRIFEYDSVVREFEEYFGGTGRVRRRKQPGFVTRTRRLLMPEENEEDGDDRNEDGDEEAEEESGVDIVKRYPVREINCKAKISCLSYNSYIKSQLISSDYEGIVSLWDASIGAALIHYDEHEKRAWSVDFSSTDPVRLASGSDDAKVKIWQTNQKSSVCTLESKANVCSVKFNPTKTHEIAFGCADHNIHYYDIRKPIEPVIVFKGHRKAVSYVKFINGNDMVTASTDSTLKLWSLKDAHDNAANFGSVRQYSGHLNEKNFVGLSLNSTGEYLACGSENNTVFGYYWKVPKPVVVHRFGNASDSMTGEEVKEEDPSVFVSSISWKRRDPNILLAANSQGKVKVMELV